MVMKCVYISEVDEGCLVVLLEDEVIFLKNEVVMKLKMILDVKIKEGEEEECDRIFIVWRYDGV